MNQYVQLVVAEDFYPSPFQTKPLRVLALIQPGSYPWERTHAKDLFSRVINTMTSD
jgi:hypothetical protein